MKKQTANSYPLEQIRIASPCTADWEKMTGNDKTRFCGECKKNVHNLSAMSRAEAEKFMANSQGKMCVMLFKRADGTVLTEDCPVGWRKMVRDSRRRAALALVSCLSIFASAMGISGCDFGSKKKPAPLAGEVCVKPTATPTPAESITPTPTPTPAVPIKGGISVEHGRTMGLIAAPSPTPEPDKNQVMSREMGDVGPEPSVTPTQNKSDPKEPIREMGEPAAPTPTPTPTQK